MKADELAQTVKTGAATTSQGSTTSTQQTPEDAVQENNATSFESHRELLRKHPKFLILALFLFAVLSASGVSLTIVFSRASLEDYMHDAEMMAADTGDFFSTNLDEAILPLFSLAQFANELEDFQELPAKVGIANEEGALPFMPSKLDQGVPTHRNVTGVCDDPRLVKRFEKIAGDIKRNARMDGILVNLQLVPDAVVCLVHPVNNTEDFPPGIYMDNSGAIGHDLLNDPAPPLSHGQLSRLKM